ncbi:MAG: ABC transporter ATP-binding protein [Elusimicrobiota bacterium]
MENYDKQNVLNIEKLSKTYKSSHFFKTISITALKDVNLNVKENEIFALIGLNGSGKTTTIKLLLGLLTPDSGNFRIFGQNKISGSVKEKIGFLPEIPYYNNSFTPVEILKFWGRLSGLKKEKLSARITRVLQYTSLENASSRKIKEFSRGMRQRLGLAQAILSEPELLILDEPMGGLDPQGIIDIRNLIQKLKEDGKTIFFTSHIIAEVEKIADRVGILHNGKILKIIKADTGLEDRFLDTISTADS